MLRCCKRPSDHDGPMYDAVTRDGSRYPLAPYLEARTLRPSAFHQGNRGLDRVRILGEGELFLAIRDELKQSDPIVPNPYRSMTAEQIHQALRKELLGRFAWLNDPAPDRISATEPALDVARLSGFLFLTLCLSVPGLVLAPIISTGRFLVLLVVATAVVAALLWRIRAPLTGKSVPSRSGVPVLGRLSAITDVASAMPLAGLLLRILVILAIYVAVASLALSIAAQLITGASFGHAFWPVARAVGLGLVSMLFTIPALVLWLRWLERRDSSQDAPPVDDHMLREMALREDRIPQNHMGSVVLVKPGILRMALFRTGHLGLHLLLRVVATDGYLGSMRTIHFAHWAFVNNGSRLMFFRNFDHSWESYLDDFIEKAHGGLTLAWGSCIGFPAARFLVLDGAQHGRQFKAWAATPWP